MKKRREKIHPTLKKWIKERGGNKKELIINFVEYLNLPRFPELVTDESRRSTKNKKSLKEADALVKEIVKTRELGTTEESRKNLKRSMVVKY